MRLGLGCPAIEALEALAASDDPKVPRHVRKCPACQGVLALIVNREPSEPLECAEVELFAASSRLSDGDQRRLAEHIETCDSCRAICGRDPETDVG